MSEIIESKAFRLAILRSERVRVYWTLALLLALFAFVAARDVVRGAETISMVTLAILFVVSAVTYVIFVVIRGDRATYRHHLSVLAHGTLIGAVGALATTPLKIASGNVQDALSLADPVGFLPIPDGFFLALLNAMDLFGIWGTLIAGFGLSIVGNRPRWGGTVAVMMVLLVVFASIVAAFQTAFGG